MAPSPLQMMIDHACDTTLREPDLALNLDIVNMINEHGLHYPRDAAMQICKNVNGSQIQSSLHALTLLDICVKNCGFPFHIVIGTKEFLNQLVKKFPERPPPSLSSVHYKILEMIQEWHETLCVNPKHQRDLKFITDMYQLLSYKGYWFPSSSAQSKNALLASEQMLKSENEIAMEERKALEAKLQQLLQLKTPAALEQANDLVKLMVGVDTLLQPMSVSKETPKVKFLQDLTRLEEKAQLLHQSLLSASTNQKAQSKNAPANQKAPLQRDVYSHKESGLEKEVAQLQSAQARLQKMAEEDTVCDEEQMDRILALNDLCGSVLANYDRFKRGQPLQELHSLPLPAVDLLDFGTETTPNSIVQDSKKNIDLLDLNDFTSIELPLIPPTTSMASSTIGATNTMIFSATNTMNPITASTMNTINPSTNLMNSINLLIPTTTAPTAMIPNATIPANTVPKATIPAPFPIDSLFNPPPASSQVKPISTPDYSLLSKTAIDAQKNQVSQNVNHKDPLSDLFSDFGLKNGITTAFTTISNSSNNMSNVSNTLPSQNHPLPNHSSTNVKIDPSLMALISSTPIPILSSTPQTVVLYNKHTLLISVALQKSNSSQSVQGSLMFRNMSLGSIDQLNFQIAVPKSMNIKLDPISSSTVPPQQTVSQNMKIDNPQKETLKFKFKLSFVANENTIVDQGDYSE